MSGKLSNSVGSHADPWADVPENVEKSLKTCVILEYGSIGRLSRRVLANISDL